MTETIVHCDRCMVRIEADRSLLNVACGPLRRLTPSLDLCGPCSDLLMGWLRGASPATRPGRDDPEHESFGRISERNGS